MDNHNYEVKPEYKAKKKIENEAYEILLHYRPDYLNDLSTNIDPYDFIFEFLPGYIRKTENRQLDVDFDKLNEDLAGYTQYDKVVLNRGKYDSENVIDQRVMNFAIFHEAYHALFHLEYLMKNSQSLQTQLYEQDSKLEKITTLHRDLHSLKNTNLLCTQANYFAGCFTIPRDRLIMALLEVFGKSCIKMEDFVCFKRGIVEIAKKIKVYLT
ncbi:hypothetical protein AGMMS49921_02140 [Endomicrobiia bacterium]|nr:hypothetical protein AGMMS49921_02140 [Endomicrobiia bacterium]